MTAGSRYDTSPISTSAKGNWVSHEDPAEGLGSFVRAVVHALIAQRGMDEQTAIATALGVMKRWSKGIGTNEHQKHVTPETIAKAKAAVAHWDELKAAAKGNRSDHATSGMVSLDLPKGTIPLVPGGEPDHHITIAFLGTDVGDDAFARACERAQTVASSMGPMSGTISGRGQFPPSESSDGKIPVFTKPDIAGIGALHDKFSDLSASEHTDYKPHVTLKYVDEGDPLPEPVPRTHVAFTRLSVHRGDEVKHFAFTGGKRFEGEGGSSGDLLPVGPTPKQAKAIVDMESHAFRGRDVQSCSKCGQPATAPIHTKKRIAQAIPPVPREAGERAELNDVLHSAVQNPSRSADVLHSAAHARRVARAQFLSDGADLEGQFVSTMTDLFKAQRASTLSRLKGTRGRRMIREEGGYRRLILPGEPTPQQPSQQPPALAGPTVPVPAMPSPPIDVGAIFDRQHWEDKTVAVTTPLYEKAGATGRLHVRGQLANAIQEGTVESGSLAKVSDVMLNRANQMAQEVTDTTYNEIRNQIAKGLALAETINQLAVRVEAVFAEADTTRAQTIARTEAHGALNQTATAYAENLPKGIVAEKRWLCVAAGTRVSSAKPSEIVERRRVSGALTVLTTRNGRVLTVTPDHPVLTDRGWIEAHALEVGANLVCAGQPQDTIWNPDKQDVPAKIDELFRAAALRGSSSRMVATVPDFYSYPTDCHVEVVPIDCDLAADIETTIREHLGERILELTDIELALLIQACSHALVGQIASVGVASPFSGCDSSLSIAPELAFGIASDHESASLGMRPQSGSGFCQPTSDSRIGDVLAASDGMDGLPTSISLDELIEVRWVWESSGHAVYDLVTDVGWFVAEGIIVHNSHHDNRTRPTHRVADTQTRPLDEPYDVGGSAMMFPGDPTGPPDEVINCRCGQMFIPAKGKPVAETPLLSPTEEAA